LDGTSFVHIKPFFYLFRPRLGPTASKVAVVGIVYFIMSSVEGFMRASVVSRHVRFNIQHWSGCCKFHQLPDIYQFFGKPRAVEEL